MISETVREYLEKYGGSEEDLIVAYYHNVLNSWAVEMRRNGAQGKRGDKYILLPRVRNLDECLGEVGVKRFFSDNRVFVEGLSEKDFSDFVENLHLARENYESSGEILGLGWKN